MRSVFGLGQIASVTTVAAGSALSPTATALASASAATTTVSSASATVRATVAVGARFPRERAVVILAIADVVVRFFAGGRSTISADGFPG